MSLYDFTQEVTLHHIYQLPLFAFASQVANNTQHHSWKLRPIVDVIHDYGIHCFAPFNIRSQTTEKVSIVGK